MEQYTMDPSQFSSQYELAESAVKDPHSKKDQELQCVGVRCSPGTLGHTLTAPRPSAAGTRTSTWATTSAS